MSKACENAAGNDAEAEALDWSAELCAMDANVEGWERAVWASS